MERTELIEQVKQVMKAQDYTQVDLAAELSVPRSNLRGWLNDGMLGKNKCSETLLSKVDGLVVEWLEGWGAIENDESSVALRAMADGGEKVSSSAIVDPVEGLIVRRPLVPGSREAEDVVFWWQSQMAAGWSMKEIGGATGYDASVISRVFAGKYPGDMDGVRQSMAEARARLLGSGGGAEIRTRTWSLVEEALTEARGTEFLTVMFGEPGIGKTHGLRTYVRGHREAVVLLTLEAATTAGSLLAELGAALGMGSAARGMSQSELVTRIVEALRRSPKLLVLDEVNNLARKPEKAARLLNVIRHINDLAHCGVALVGTLNLFELLFSTRSAAEMEMVRSRVGTEVELPGPGDLSLRAFLQAHFGRFEDRVWGKWLSLAKKDCGGGEPTLRRAAIFVSHARQVAVANGDLGEVRLGGELVEAGWGRMRRRR